jgi:hypothetical protein
MMNRRRFLQTMSVSLLAGPLGAQAHHYQLPLGGGPGRAVSCPRRRLPTTQGGHHRRNHHSGRPSRQDSNPDGPDRHALAGRSGSDRARREPRPTWGQCHRDDVVGVRACCQASRVAQGNRAPILASARALVSRGPHRGAPGEGTGRCGSLTGSQAAGPRHPHRRRPSGRVRCGRQGGRRRES